MSNCSTSSLSIWTPMTNADITLSLSSRAQSRDLNEQPLNTYYPNDDLNLQ